MYCIFTFTFISEKEIKVKNDKVELCFCGFVCVRACVRVLDNDE
jgi:hypothetical protein